MNKGKTSCAGSCKKILVIQNLHISSLMHITKMVTYVVPICLDMLQVFFLKKIFHLNQPGT